MDISVQQAIERLDRQGVVGRFKELFLESMIAHAAFVLGRPLPVGVETLYRERVKSIGEFLAILPSRSGRMGWEHGGDQWLENLRQVQAYPLFGDGCGNIFGLDLASGDREPAVYFFDHERLYERPEYAAGSTLARFLMLLALHDRAIEEDWSDGWELEIDPDIDTCPRARAIWNAG